MRSLKTRLTVGMTGSMALLLALFGSLLYLAIRRAFIAEIDGSLAAAARAVAASVRIDDGELEIEVGAGHSARHGDEQPAIQMQVWLPDGTPLRRSGPPQGQDLPAFGGRRGELVHRAMVLPGGRAGRAVGLRFTPAIEEDDEDDQPPDADERASWLAAVDPLTLVVARETTDMEARLRQLRWLLVGVGAVTMAASAGVAGAIARRGLAPLSVLAGRIAGIGEGSLATRMPSEPLGQEMAPVVAKLNELLARLQAAFDRERAFSADVAHELRTPLAGIRSTLDVCLSRGRRVEEYQESLADLRAIAVRMQSMIESLLVLARLESGQTALRAETIHLAELVDVCWEPLTARAEARSLSFGSHVPPDVSCRADRDAVILVLTNLLDNAVEYTPPGGRIRVEGRRRNGIVELTIANTGCRLTTAQVAQVFERFWRADTSRCDTGAHAGLGLALVRRMAALLGGEVAAEVDADGVFAVRLLLIAGRPDGPLAP